MNTVLIIDDEEKLRSLLSRIISLEGFEVIEVANCKAALKKIETTIIDVVLCDVKLPDGNGIELIKEIKNRSAETEIISLTAYGNITDGVQAIKNGAFDYITKGDDNNKIIPLLHRAIDKVNLSKRITELEKKVRNKYSFDNIIGRSKNILHVIELAKKVSLTDTSVLLLGETGTGKEVFAQAIHQNSNRNSKPFVALNCSAFIKELLESELFGYKAGAFTGAASKDKKGLFEEANNGTIFLDEIGEMPVELQAKLLRVLETQELLRVGDSKIIKVNVRIIAATNKNIEEEIQKNNFRADLFYRLAAFQIHLPSLKERKADIPLLAKHFADVFTIKTKKGFVTLHDDCIHALEQYQWPGNIRELKNVIERSVILSDSNSLTVESLPFEIQTSININGNQSLSAFSLASIEKLHIQKVLNYTKGNKTETAKLLNIGLTTLYRKIEEYKIS